MKKNYTLRPWMMLIPAAMLFASCASSSVQMQLLVPADITVPNEVKHIALINRFYPEKRDKTLGVVEGVLSGENIGQDRRAAEAALSGLTNALAGSPRFSITRPNRDLEGTGRADFPPPIPVATVTEICRTASANALVTIEAFDSDTRLACVPEQRTRKTREGVEERYTVFVATKSIDVTVGWRMYNAENGVLLDEYRMFETVDFRAEGAAEGIAIANLPGKEQVVQEVGRVTGLRYSARISPTWMWVSRAYYKKGSAPIKAAKRAVRANDWERATQLWEKSLDDPKVKVQGRALYNLALATEMRGDLQSALDMAREAASRYGNRKAVQYSYILEQRLDDQRRLDAQMEGAK